MSELKGKQIYLKPLVVKIKEMICKTAGRREGEES